jgi:hypothetical protein
LNQIYSIDFLGFKQKLKKAVKEKPNAYTKLPEEATKKWKALTDQQQYTYFRQAVIEARKAKDKAKEFEDSYNKLKEKANETITVLEKNSVKPRFGFSFGTTTTVDKYLTFNLLLDSKFYVFFGKYFFISMGGVIQPYKEIGGGFNFNFGIIF